MSEPASALGGAVFEGIARVEEAGPRGMITLKGDLSAARLKNAAKALAGVEVPGPGEARVQGAHGLLWMAPDELLVLTPHAEAAAGVAALGKALGGTHHLVADVSDARAAFRVSGPGAREVLAKLTPADLHPDVFGPGTFRRTRLAQVPAAIWLGPDGAFEVICFRSVARYVFDILAHAARPGTAPGYY